ncbi:MAG TPA: cytochrome d ubiquinol oxidase subunit II [Longimicrobiales bacterium]|nr:cytochrome d ubiquinol oxidase subunit II [Longimicrobiales bacterium]
MSAALEPTGLALVAGLVMLVALVAYAVMGGADFGGGVWDLFARGPRAEAQRQTIATAMGPIWEANHVWLIVVVVLLFTCFPRAFAVIMTALHVPIAIMLVGIVLRGSSFVFRTYDEQTAGPQRRWGRVFAVSSVVTPVLLGVVIGAISSPEIRVVDGVVEGGFFRPWLRPFPFAVGLFALAQFAFLAAVYLTVDAETEALREDFRRRALAAAVAVGALAGGTLLLAGNAAPELRAALLGRPWSWPLQLATGGAALGAIGALLGRRWLLARVLAAAQVALIMVGWGLAMSPWLVWGSVSMAEAAAPQRTLELVLLILAGGSVILLPAFYYLYRTFKGGLIFAPLGGPTDSDSGPTDGDSDPT